ncbi:MAG TPA: ABC transporter ATP-binding protein, partial [Candidatus Omnitrophica bacterium]|nr:ABC transporter ATP-binding protein [Candidatus Omnitrophota bacterium]
MSSLRRFLHYTRPYRGLILAAVSFGVIRYLIPLALPWTLKILVDDLLIQSASPPRGHLHLLMAGMCGLYVVYAFASYFRSYLAGLAGHRIIFDLRQQLYLHVQRMSLSFFDRQQIGAVVARMTSDIASAQNFVGSAMVNTTMDLSCVAVIIGLLFAANPRLALVSLSVIPFYVLISYRLTKRIRKKSRDIHNQLQEISGDLHEQFAAISTIQAFTQEEAEAREFRQQSERYLDTVLSNVRLQSIALGATGFLTALGPILVLWVGAMEVWAGRLSIGTLMAFYAYLGMLYQPIQRLTELNLILTNSLAAMDRIFEVFEMYPEVQQRPGAISLSRATGEIVFDRVAFRYEGREPVLEGFDLRIPAGTTVALVGPSGAGKSTLLTVIGLIRPPDAGRIVIEGKVVFDGRLRVDSRSFRRKHLGFVFQKANLIPFLTAVENVQLAMEINDTPPRMARKRALDLLEYLGMADRATHLPAKLSGGQQQRVAVARALANRPGLLLADEPTGNL